MATVASGIIVCWPSTNGSIPSGWARKTSLDTRYAAIAAGGADADLTTDNGNTDHNHTMAAHNHTFSGNSYTPANHPNSAPTTTVAGTHTHASATGSNATATLANTTNDLLRLPVIFIESNGTPTGVPSGAIAMFRSDTLPGSWTRVNGNGYLKGAAGGGDGSTTQTGANSHTHTSTGHTHAAATSTTRTGTDGTVLASGVTVLSSPGHTHQVSLNSTSITFSTETVEPPFRKINMIKNDTGGTSLPNKLVAFWNGANGSIPTDWTRLTDWDGTWVKGANADGESDVTTGGTPGTHTHTQTHTHAASDAGGVGQTLADDTVQARGARGAEDGHQHSWTIGNNSTPSDASTSAAHYPKYRTLILVEWTDPAGSASTPLRTLMGVGV